MRATLVILASLLAVGCGDGDATPDAGGSSDASAPDATSTDASTTDAPAGCAADQHLCDGVCTDDGFNDPAEGCRLGCGEPCPGGTDALCTEEGTCMLRSCTPMSCEDLGVMCGLADDGCGRRQSCGTCDAASGQSCVDSACVCMPDDNEPNDTRTGLPSLATLNDYDDPPAVPLDGTIHQAGDEDWYRLTIVDGGAGGNPVIRVELEGAPAGSDYVVSAYLVCGSGGDATTCTEGANDDSVGQGCTSAGRSVDRVILGAECSGIDDDGTLWVRVRAPTWGGTCGGYTARVTVT